MTYQNINIDGYLVKGKEEDLCALISDFLLVHDKMIVTAEDVYNYWKSRNWRTKKGYRVSTLEIAVSVVNGLAKENRLKRNTHTLPTCELSSLYKQFESFLEDCTVEETERFQSEINGVKSLILKRLGMLPDYIEQIENKQQNN